MNNVEKLDNRGKVSTVWKGTARTLGNIFKKIITMMRHGILNDMKGPKNHEKEVGANRLIFQRGKIIFFCGSR